MIGLVFTAVLLGVFVVPAVLKAVVAPKLPGFATKAPAGAYTDLDWKILTKGDVTTDDKPLIPAPIKALNGKLVSVRASMIPFHSDTTSSRWYLAEKPRMCYFCSPPGIAEVVEVDVAGGKQVPITDWSVRAYGKLKVATGKRGEALYTIEDAVLVIS